MRVISTSVHRCRWPALAVGVLLGCAGCGFDPECPPASPANDPNNLPKAVALDLPGVWQISFTGNLSIVEAFGWRQGLAGRFISFDTQGQPLFEGVVAPGGTALWQWNLQTGLAAPSQVAAGALNREGPAVEVTPHNDGTITIEIRYRQPFQSRTDLAETDVTIRYERMRLNAKRNVLTGLRREIRDTTSLTVPLPAEEEVAWRVSLRRVAASLQAEAGALIVTADAAPREGRVAPFPVGQVFDLAGSLDPSSTSTVVTQWAWIVYRTVRDDEGDILDRQSVAELEGRETTFTADSEGTYSFRLWATDGGAWVSAPTVDVVVD